jgi:mitotic spindle assembly checkpoint protein MAD1
MLTCPATGSKPSEDAPAKMTLVARGEGTSEDVDAWLRTWVAEEGCIPGLLATVTLDAYDRWKAGGGLDGEGEDEQP